MADITVTVDQINVHATHMQGFADRVDNCAANAKSNDFGLDSYWIVGQIFAVALHNFSSTTTRSLALVTRDIHDISTQLTSTATCYHDLEQAIGNVLNEIGEGH